MGHTYTYIHTHIHTYIHAYTHAYTHTHIHIHTHTCIHTYIHTYMPIAILAQSCVPSVSRHWVPSCSVAQATIDGCLFKQVNPVPVKQELEEGDDKPFGSDRAR